MPDRDEDKSLQQAEFSKGARDVARQELESARGDLRDRDHGTFDRGNERAGAKQEPRDPSVVHQDKARVTELPNGEKVEYKDTLFRSKDDRYLSISESVGGDGRGLINARSSIEADHRMTDGVGRRSLESYEIRDASIFRVPTHTEKSAGLAENRSEFQPGPVTPEYLQSRIEEYRKE